MTDPTAPVANPELEAKAAKVWLVHNKSSGSNDDDALEALRDAFGTAGLSLVGDSCFPRDDAPSPADLDGAGADTVAIFAGDGTISSVVAGLGGWQGAVLPLPGGTMNMLARRLHGDATAPEVVARLKDGIVQRVRPTVLQSRHAVGLTGALAGPGTAWADVREAMRDPNLKELVSTASEAISSSTGGAKVVCLDADCGREEGYTAITLTPRDDGIEGAGYYTASLADYARHGVALLQRDFRSGPNESLGRHRKLRIASSNKEPMGLLIDGESYDGDAEEEFELGASHVDFWATADAR
ncbi:diacylglycerol kinase family protein [Novosphingobium sp. 9U]|uniref:diacylglycerol/lipid kinase family protein n=1 Tax=Novosphingobium sp. 9U TaxID=2653158 RepID=UPI0012EF83CF|nr:diacylglycerol kinase family protein [Novosphingobium sp. 9U]VWX53696.1 Diacylglycerol kinase [Novosphingobium sp. 9U]